MPQETPKPVPQVEPIAPAPESAAVRDMDPKTRWQLQRLATIAATATLAVLSGTPRLAETSIENPLHPEDPVTRVVPGSERPPIIKVGDKEVKVNVDQQTEKFDVAQEIWAKLFSADPEAGKLTGLGELTKVRHRIENLREKGFRVTRVGLEGHASAEDNSVDANGQRTSGIQTPDKQNRSLANERARDFRTLVKGDLKDHQETIPPIEITTPIEDMLTDSERERVQKLASENGYEHVVTMIEDYNRGEGVSTEVGKYLDEILAKERKVVVTIDAERNDVFRTDLPNGEMIPGGNPPSVETVPGDGDNRIPLVLPLLVFLPIYRRRKTEQPPEEPPTRPPVGPPLSPEEPPREPPTEPPKPPRPVGRLPRDAAFKQRIMGGGSIERNIPAIQTDKRPRTQNFNRQNRTDRTGSRPSGRKQNRSGGRPAPNRNRGQRRPVAR